MKLGAEQRHIQLITEKTNFGEYIIKINGILLNTRKTKLAHIYQLKILYRQVERILSTEGVIR
jgi:hypothetical protein